MLLKSAFRNLIKNAYLYSDNKTVHISIETQPKIIVITFVNTGSILSEEEKEKMYIPFFRGNNAMTSKGFGLGLSIVNKIADIHNAKLNYTAFETNTNKFAISFYL